MIDTLKRNRGFTLVEVLIALVIGSIAMGGIYSVYITQNQSYTAQDQVAEMQQNLRAALYMMERDIRMAGYDPTGAGGFGITNVSPTNSITLSADFDGDGTNENITYSISGTNLNRNGTILAENIQSLGFAYAFDQDGDGAVDATAAGNTIWAIDTTGDNQLDVNLDTTDDGVIDTNDNPAGAGFAGAPVGVGSIRAVRIWVLARTGRQDPKFINQNTYVVADQRIMLNDNFRRHLLTTTIKCRNMGL